MDGGQALGGVGTRLGHGHGAHGRVPFQASVQRAQERPALPFVVLPGVLAVEDHEHGGLFPAALHAVALSGGGDASHEVVGRRLRIPRRVGEPNEVRQQMVAEAARHGGLPVADLVGAIQVGVPRKGARQRARQDLLVGGHPGESGLGDERHHRVGDRALRGPEPGRRAFITSSSRTTRCAPPGATPGRGTRRSSAGLRGAASSSAGTRAPDRTPVITAAAPVGLNGSTLLTTRNAADITQAVRDARTSLLLHDVPKLIEWITGVMTLLPGDVILTGTPAGVGPMTPGQSVSVTIEGIGTLTNPVAAR